MKNNGRTQIINATLNIIEGVVTLKFKNTNDLNKYMNAITVTNTAIQAINNTGESGESEETNGE